MARADSTIRVNIVGDAKGLQKELATADKGIKGFGTKAQAIVGGIAAAAVAAELVSFGQTALNEADRLGDAAARLEISLGPDLAGALTARASDFEKLGQSAQDVLELEAAFTDTATALGVSAPLIAGFADDAAATAAAIALMGDEDPSTVIDLIGKAAGGSDKALKALGINLTDAEVAARAMRDTGKDVPELLTDSEKAAAAYSLVLEKLKPKLDAAAAGNGDVEQSLSELDAKFETFTGRVGQAIEGPLNDLLGMLLDLTTSTDGATSAFEDFGRAIVGIIGNATGAIRGLQTLLGLIRAVQGQPDIQAPVIPGSTQSTGQTSGPGGGLGGAKVYQSAPVTVNINGGDPAQVELAVKRAIGGYRDRNGALMWDP